MSKVLRPFSSRSKQHRNADGMSLRSLRASMRMSTPGSKGAAVLQNRDGNQRQLRMPLIGLDLLKASCALRHKSVAQKITVSFGGGQGGAIATRSNLTVRQHFSLSGETWLGCHPSPPPPCHRPGL
eukprot:2363247-Rhodomonas_salina.2